MQSNATSIAYCPMQLFCYLKTNTRNEGHGLEYLVLIQSVKAVNFLVKSVWFLRCMLRDSTTRFVGPSVRWSIRPSVTLYFFGVFMVFGLTAPAQMIWRPWLWPLPTRTPCIRPCYLRAVGHGDRRMDLRTLSTVYSGFPTIILV